jgi:teichoic acid transport system permease protein
LRALKDIYAYKTYIIYSAKARLRAEVANSYLNWLWWVVEPVCLMLIYSLIFGYVYGAREPYFAVFLFIGITMWNFFSRTITNSTTMIWSNVNIISKVYLPKYVLLLSEMCTNAFKMLISFIITAILIIITRVPITLRILWIIPILLAFFLITFAAGAFCLHISVYIRDLTHAVGILLSLLMFLTGIFFNIETMVPPPYGYFLGRCNPVAFLMISFRRVVIYDTTPSLPVLALWLGISILLAIWGVRMIYKNENSYVKIL